MITAVLGKEGIGAAAQLIKEGEVVAFPTETVYGLGGDAFSVSAVKKIFQAKGRPQDNPLIVHIAKIQDAERLSDNIPSLYFKLAEAFMPGPLTLVIPKGKNLPSEVTAGLNSVGVRLPAHPIAQKIIELSGKAVAAPSANASKHISPTSAKHVYDDLKGKIPLIIDGGSCEVGIESTVLSLVTEVPTILRPGFITERQLSEVIGEVKTFNGKIITSAPAPGMKYRHYAPKKPAVLSENPQNTAEKYDVCVEGGGNPVILTSSDRIQGYAGRRCIDLGKDGAEAAHNLYDALHKGEAYDLIIIDGLAGGGVSKSVMNRIIKATAE